MTEIDSNFLKEGEFYLFFKKYKIYNPDIIIGQFTRSAYESSDTVTLKNVVKYDMGAMCNIRKFIYNNAHDLYIYSRDSTCWIFKLEPDEVNTHIVMELV